VLIGGVSLVGSELDASLGASVGVFDRPGVARGQFIKFVDAVADGLSLPLDIVLAGEGIDASPEAFAGRGRQRLTE